MNCGNSSKRYLNNLAPPFPSGTTGKRSARPSAHIVERSAKQSFTHHQTESTVFIILAFRCKASQMRLSPFNPVRGSGNESSPDLCLVRLLGWRILGPRQTKAVPLSAALLWVRIRDWRLRGMRRARLHFHSRLLVRYLAIGMGARNVSRMSRQGICSTADCCLPPSPALQQRESLDHFCFCAALSSLI